MHIFAKVKRFFFSDFAFKYKSKKEERKNKI